MNPSLTQTQNEHKDLDSFIAAITETYNNQIKWATHNFPEATYLEPMLGLNEEAAELEIAHSNLRRLVNAKECYPNILHSKMFTKEYRDTEAYCKDALGDILVFAAHYCSLIGINFPTKVEQIFKKEFPDMPDYLKRFKIDDFTQTPLGVIIGILSHVTLKRKQGIRGFDDEAQFITCANYLIMCLLEAMATSFGGGVFQLYIAVGKEVFKRDWVANPVSQE